MTVTWKSFYLLIDGLRVIVGDPLLSTESHLRGILLQVLDGPRALAEHEAYLGKCLWRNGDCRVASNVSCEIAHLIEAQ